jgi:hypothetical protein
MSKAPPLDRSAPGHRGVPPPTGGINVHYYNMPLYQRLKTLYNNKQMAHRYYPVATVEHVAHVRLLLAPTAVMCSLTSVDHCYYHQQ